MNKVFGFLLATLISGNSIAIQPTEENSYQKGTNRADNRLEFFHKLQKLESESHQQRMGILQQAENCISQAENFREYRKCEQQEKQARQAFRDKHKPKMQALRQEFRAQRRD